MAGLADLLASSNNPRWQLGGKLFGGVDEFSQKTGQLYDAMDKASTREEIQAVGKQFAQAWIQSGRPINEHFEKALDGFTAPALRNLRAGEMDAIQRDYGPQTTPITPAGSAGRPGQPLGEYQFDFRQPRRKIRPDPEGAMSGKGNAG
jgi:hypothetical protein